MQNLVRLSMVAVLVAMLGAFAFSPVEAATLQVTASDLQGWVIMPDGTVPYAFGLGPSAPPSGDGSLHVGPIRGAAMNKFIMSAPYTNALASDFQSFRYSVYVDPASEPSNSLQHFYSNIYVDSSTNGIGTYATWYDCRYNFVPGGSASGTWITASYDSSTTSWDSIANQVGDCPSSLGSLPSGSLIMMITLSAGDSSTGDEGLMGAFDDVVITTNSGSTSYNFEADPVSGKNGPGPDMVHIPEGSVVGTFRAPTPLHWAPRADAATPYYMEPGQSLWITGMDETGQFYQIILSGKFLWVPVNSMGPTYNETWEGHPLPTQPAGDQG